MPRAALSAGFREVSKTDLDPGLRELWASEETVKSQVTK